MKILITLILTILILFIIVFSVMSIDKKNYEVTSYDNLVANNEEYILYFFSYTCTACISFSEELDKFIEIYDIKVNALDISDEDNKEVMEEFEVYSVPTIIILDENKKEIDRYEGYMTFEEMEEILIGYQKEIK